MRRFLIFISIATSILVLCGYYLGHRFISGSSYLASHPTAVWSGIVAFLGLVFIGPMMSRILPPRFAGRLFPLRWTINMTMAVFFAVLFYTFTIDLATYLLGFIVDAETSVVLQAWSLPIIALLAIVTFVVGAVQALSPKVYRVDVPIKNLPTEFSGFKIAQISDLHIGEMIGASYVKSVVEKTNDLKADVIAMTGDIIDGAHEMIAPVAKGLADLRATDGVLYVTGNHEYYWGIEGALSEMRAAGAKILSSEHVRIRRGGSEIAIAGLPYISAGAMPGHNSDPKRALIGVPDGMTKILLAHQPVVYRTVEGLGFDLQLSGHTHGGQFFPWSLVVRLFQHYNKGLIRHGDMWIYVNRGTATWGPRMRFGIPPEITLLTLTRA